jgi:hypothetical protein
MNLAKTLFWSNGLLLVSALLQACTGALLFFELDLVIGFPVSDIHKYNGPILALLIVLHIILNWKWFKAHYFSKK